MQRKPSIRHLPPRVADTLPASRDESSDILSSVQAHPVLGSALRSAFAEAGDRRARAGEGAPYLPSFPEEGGNHVEDFGAEVSPVVTWGGAATQGERRSMEDAHVGILDLEEHLGRAFQAPHSRSFFGLFDGHGGTSAAEFARDNLLGTLADTDSFSLRPEEALVSAFLDLDEQFYQAVKERGVRPSGSTMLAALLWGPKLMVANAGDSRAVLCRHGRAVDLSHDHKPIWTSEKDRIAQKGGYVCAEGFLNGQLGVSRAMGDYHLEGLKCKPSTCAPLEGPLTARPDVKKLALVAEDEFLLLACDGLWDVMTSQRAVELARQCLQQNDNDPSICAQMLVDTSLGMHASDNVTVIVVCLKAEVPPKREFGSRDKVRRSFSQNGLDTINSFLKG